MIIRIVAVAVLALLIVARPAAVAHGDEGGIGWGSGTRDDDFEVEGRFTSSDLPANSLPPKTVATNSNGPVVEYLRGTQCNRPALGIDLSPNCEGSVPVPIDCPEGTTLRDPLFSRTQADDGTWSAWEMLSWYQCAEQGNADALIVAIEREWATLTPQSPTMVLQPQTGWVYANVPTIAIADGAVNTTTATLLGVNVDIRASPQTYTWEWGDGESTTTTDPGSPYPDATVTHTYAHRDEPVVITLSTTWSGQYRVDGGVWVDFATSLTSVSPSTDLEVRSPHSQLVDCTLDGDCGQFRESGG